MVGYLAFLVLRIHVCNYVICVVVYICSSMVYALNSSEIQPYMSKVLNGTN